MRKIEKLGAQIVIQPIYGKTGRFNVIGEALVRKNLSSKAAKSVLEIVESENLFVELDLYVVKRVCEFIKMNEDELNGGISVNISSESLKYRQLFSRVKSIAKKSEIDPGRLMIEMPEEPDLSHSTVRNNILKFVDSDHPVLLDDFGTTRESVQLLKAYDFSIIKLDKEIIKSIATCERSYIIFESILGMLSKMKKEIVIEGVESSCQLEKIKTLAPNCGLQGFLLGRPMPTERFLSEVVKGG